MVCYISFTMQVTHLGSRFLAFQGSRIGDMHHLAVSHIPLWYTLSESLHIRQLRHTSVQAHEPRSAGCRGKSLGQIGSLFSEGRLAKHDHLTNSLSRN